MKKSIFTFPTEPNIKLKNGAAAPKSVVDEIYANINSLNNINIHNDITALHELGQKSLDNKHKIFGNCIGILISRGFINEDESFCPYVEDIIKSSITITGCSTSRISDPTEGNILSVPKKSSSISNFLKPLFSSKAKVSVNGDEYDDIRKSPSNSGSKTPDMTPKNIMKIPLSPTIGKPKYGDEIFKSSSSNLSGEDSEADNGDLYEI